MLKSKVGEISAAGVQFALQLFLFFELRIVLFATLLRPLRGVLLRVFRNVAALLLANSFVAFGLGKLLDCDYGILG